MTSNKRTLTTIGTRVQDLREQSNLKQYELAKIIGVTRETINHWESNSRQIKAQQISELAKFFNVTCDYIINGVSTDNVQLHRETGLNDDAINQLKKSHKGNSLPGLNTGNNIYYNFMLSNKNFMDEIPKRLSDYSEKKLEDTKHFILTGQNKINEETDVASYLLIRLMQKLADDFCEVFHKPHIDNLVEILKDNRKRNLEIAKKRKEGANDSNNAND